MASAETTGQIPLRLVALLRQSVFGGDERALETGEPLGEEGLGLDSLGLVQFLTSVEAEFGVAIPMEVWSEISRTSIDELSQTIVGLYSDG